MACGKSGGDDRDGDEAGISVISAAEVGDSRAALNADMRFVIATSNVGTAYPDLDVVERILCGSGLESQGRAAGRSTQAADHGRAAGVVSPDFFSALGIAIKRGRAFTDFDRVGAPLVAIVNESAAKRVWGTDEAVGRRFRLGTVEGPIIEVVGIAEDARFRNLTTDLSAARVEPDVYVPFAQRPDVDIEIAVRTQQAAALSIEDLQRATTAVDASLPLYRVRQLQDAVREQTSTARFGSALLTAFSGGALLLAAIGLYGLISYIVSLSRTEIGIRLALGADTRRVITLILGNGMALVVTGLVFGALGAAAAGRALEAQLYQARSRGDVIPVQRTSGSH